MKTVRRVTLTATRRKPKPCRYCGCVAADHARDTPNYGGLYSCRDVRACGQRICGTLVALDV